MRSADTEMISDRRRNARARTSHNRETDGARDGPAEGKRQTVRVRRVIRSRPVLRGCIMESVGDRVIA